MTPSKKINLLVAYIDKEMKIDPFDSKSLDLVRALNTSLDTALILMELINQEGEHVK